MLVIAVLLGIIVGQWSVPAARVVSAQATVPPSLTVSAPIPVKPVDEDAVYDELNRQYAQFEQVNRTFELAAKAVAPAVVHIVAKKAGRGEGRRGVVQSFEETGSGVIVRLTPGGELYVLTNNHVVENALTADVAITLNDGRVLHPERFWTDRKADIAVLRLARNDLPAARLGDSDQAVTGTWVLALGSPFGLTHSVSHGIISARNRHEADLEDNGVENQEFLQTDAAINPGNSGGPLVNLKGEVIGINTAMASNSNSSAGVGFSIPINLAKWIMAQLVTRGKVSRGALGVNLKDINAEVASARGLDRPRGAFVLYVGEKTPAALAGLRTGDVVMRYDGVEVADINQLINLVSRTPVGKQVDIVLWRDRKLFSVRLAVADQEAIAAAAMPDDSTPSGGGANAPLRRPVRPGPAHGDGARP